MYLCKNPTYSHLWTQKAEGRKALNESWWKGEKGSKRSMNRIPYRERDREEEREKSSGAWGVWISNEWGKEEAWAAREAVGSPRPAAAAGSWTRGNRFQQRGALICQQQFLHVWPASPAWGLVPVWAHQPHEALPEENAPLIKAWKSRKVPLPSSWCHPPCQLLRVPLSAVLVQIP